MPPNPPNRDKRKKSESKDAESSRYNVGYMQKRKEESVKRREKKRKKKKTQAKPPQKRPKKGQEMQKQKSPNPTQPKPKPESIPSKSNLLGAKPVVPFHHPPTQNLVLRPTRERGREKGNQRGEKKRSQQKFQKTNHTGISQCATKGRLSAPASSIIPSLRHELSMSQTLRIGSSHKNHSAKANSSVP
jgi:hypothetical protein